MIIPTAEFDPLFARDGIPFRTRMLEYIEREFADVLGARVALLHQPGGLEQLAATRLAPSERLATARRAA